MHVRYVWVNALGQAPVVSLVSLVLVWGSVSPPQRKDVRLRQRADDVFKFLSM